MDCREATRFEQLDAVGRVHGPDERTMFRATAAICMYLSLDRPDVMFSSKELRREFAAPTSDNVLKLKRVVRYLVTVPRVTWLFKFEPATASLNIYPDTCFGGCMGTRRSTSGGVANIGSHVIQCWAKTQSDVAPSSAEAELTGICQAAGEGFGLQALCADLGLALELHTHTHTHTQTRPPRLASAGGAA